MSTTDNLLFNDIRAALLREVERVIESDNYEEAFVLWLLHEQITKLNPSKISERAVERFNNTRDYKDLAALGYIAASRFLDIKYVSALKQGLEWIAGREPFIEGVPVGFTGDPVGVLGIALGVSCLEDKNTIDKISNWVSKFIGPISELRRIEDWHKCLFAAVQQILGHQITINYQSTTNLDVCVALRSLDLLPLSTKERMEEDEKEVLLLLKKDFNTYSLVRSALRLKSFEWINRTQPTINLGRPSVEEVAGLLQRIPASMRRWTWESTARTRNSHPQKWYIENEYHVQNLLYAILAPFFPDLLDEVSTPTVGPKHPRADLVIPSLRLIIEAKYMYPNTTPQTMIGEIAEDASLYLVEGSNYSKIIAFIWDAAARTEHYDTMRQGMKKLPGVVDAIIMSCPGFMLANPINNNQTTTPS